LLDSKKKVGAYDKDENRYKDKQENYDDDEVDDYHPSLSSYGDSPYSGFSPAEGNYRTRARWPSPSPSSSSSSLFLSSPPSSYDDFMNGNDLSRFEFPKYIFKILIFLPCYFYVLVLFPHHYHPFHMITVQC